MASLQYSIASFSFHRLLKSGKQDAFGYIADCKALGCSVLEPWNGTLAGIRQGDDRITPGNVPAGPDFLNSEEHAYVKKIRETAEAAGMPFGCLAVDGGHLYEADERMRRANRARAYRWMQVAEILGATSMRIDTGGGETLPDEIMPIIVEGYKDLIARGKARGIAIVVENHWGPTKYPDNLLKVLSAVPGLGYLFDSHNWHKPLRDEARKKCAKFATATHIKPLDWDAEGNEIGEDLVSVIRLLIETGYKGVWGIESCPKNGDEMAGVKNSIALLKRVLEV